MIALGGLLAWISREDGSAIALGAGAVAASLVAVIALFRQPVVYRPIRWFGRKLGVIGWVLVGDPLAKVIKRALDEWAHAEGSPVQVMNERLISLENQNVRNAGSTNRDRLNAIGRAVGADPDPVGHD